MRDYTKIAIEKPEKVFFTADLHLYHENIINLCGRPFKDANEMKENIITNWNAWVPADGLVFVLGDMFWKCGLDKCRQTMERLNGRKWLIAGNHDSYSREEYLAMGFEDARNYLELSIEHKLLVLFHYPLLEWNGFYRGSWHLHGHVHGTGDHFSFRVMDVGVDANQFTPVSWSGVKKYLEGGFELDQEKMRNEGNLQRHSPYSFNKDKGAS